MCKYQVYKDAWKPLIGEKLVAERGYLIISRPKFPIQVLTVSHTIGHLPSEFLQLINMVEKISIEFSNHRQHCKKLLEEWKFPIDWNVVFSSEKELPKEQTYVIS